MASKPKLPDPANKSRQVAPSMKGVNQLNKVSLTLPKVGLVFSLSRKEIFFPFNDPAIILTELVI
jgi:hypothetical protein